MFNWQCPEEASSPPALKHLPHARLRPPPLACSVLLSGYGCNALMGFHLLATDPCSLSMSTFHGRCNMNGKGRASASMMCLTALDDNLFSVPCSSSNLVEPQGVSSEQQHQRSSLQIVLCKGKSLPVVVAALSTLLLLVISH